MKRRIVAACVSVLCIASPRVSAQDCKPTMSRQDKIAKQQIDVWAQNLFSTGFLSGALLDDDFDITATIGRYGDTNAINLELKKEMEMVARAAFDSKYVAVKGDQFSLGFGSGNPLTFITTEVNNQTKVNSLSGRVVTTVVLSAHVSDKDLATHRDSLTGKPIDAVRISLEGGVLIEKNVSDKNGKRMMEKFSCFYQSLDKRGINLAASGAGTALSPEEQAKVVGRYIRKDKTSDCLDVNADGTFGLRQDGKNYSGTFAVQGDAFIITQGGRTVPSGRFVGNTLEDPGGTVWERASEPQKDTGAKLTIDQIIQMVGAKLSDEIVIAAIEKSASKFDMTADNLIRLKAAGVSDAVLRTMLK